MNHFVFMFKYKLKGGVTGGGGKCVVEMGHNNRRALSDINRNVIGAPPCPGAAVNKRGISE